jgi:hypothetical protein
MMHATSLVGSTDADPERGQMALVTLDIGPLTPDGFTLCRHADSRIGLTFTRSAARHCSTRDRRRPARDRGGRVRAARPVGPRPPRGPQPPAEARRHRVGLPGRRGRTHPRFTLSTADSCASSHNDMTRHTLTEVLRERVRRAPVTMLELARLTGVQRSSLIRFRDEESSLRLDMADRLAAHFGLELRVAQPTGGKRG